MEVYSYTLIHCPWKPFGATSKLAFAQPGVEPALMALFQRDVHQFVTPDYEY